MTAPRLKPMLAAQAAAAAIVGCRYCGAKPDQPCLDKSLPVHRPAKAPHPCRIADARRKRTKGTGV